MSSATRTAECKTNEASVKSDGRLNHADRRFCATAVAGPQTRIPAQDGISQADVNQYGITVKTVYRNTPVPMLYELASRYESSDTVITRCGAMAARSGSKTGRTPKDKRIVKEKSSEDVVWWESDACIPLSEDGYALNRDRAIAYLNTRDRIYVVDALAGWDPENQVRVRIICARAYHALFMHNMLIRLSRKELEGFEPELVVFNAGQMPANRFTPGVTSETSVALHLAMNEAVILGTQYAGEMKKGVFTFMHYIMPKRGHLTMHSSVNVSMQGDNATLFFGLSGTGKTTLSTDEGRLLVGDDEHVWTDAGLFNIEGGCYAKTIDLSEASEPLIYRAIRYGSVLENVVYDSDRRVDYTDSSITLNTRVAYPIEFIPNAKIPCVSSHPRNVIYLTCDSFGVLPPISKLTHAEAMYHFIQGYTSKVAGTEMGIKTPQPVFSACFGEAFLILHPAKYAALLGKKLLKHTCSAWLVNTGWSGGAYGVGKRMRLKVTRAIVDAINEGKLENTPMVQNDSVFRFKVPVEVPGVPSDILQPRNTWGDKAAYDRDLETLGRMFVANFSKFKAGATKEILSAGPTVNVAKSSL